MTPRAGMKTASDTFFTNIDHGRTKHEREDSIDPASDRGGSCAFEDGRRRPASVAGRSGGRFARPLSTAIAERRAEEG
jgi:hypothetical protein